MQEVHVDTLDDGELGYAFDLIKSERSPIFDVLNGEMSNSLCKFIPEYLKFIYNKYLR